MSAGSEESEIKKLVSDMRDMIQSDKTPDQTIEETVHGGFELIFR